MIYTANTRRTFLKQGAATAGALSVLPAILTACGDSTTAASGTLVIAQPDTPPLLDGDQAFSSLAEEIMANCYEGDIVRYRESEGGDGGLPTAGLAPGNQGILPGVAEEFTASRDLTQFEFRLRQEALSFFGNPPTAEGVKWSFDRRRAIEGVGAFFTDVMLLDQPGSVEVVDEFTVRFQTPEPSTLLLKVDAVAYYSGLFDYTEVRNHITTDDPWAEEWLGRNTAGFGPYHVESYRKGQDMTLVRNPNYFGPEPPFERVIWRVVSASSDRVALLSRGDVSVATNLTPRELVDVQEDENVALAEYRGNKVKHIKLNNEVEPLNDARVRRALAFATPYSQILEDVYFGLAVPLRSPVPDIIPGSTDEFWEYDTDIAAARELLVDAGFADGFELELLYDVSVPEDELIGRIISTAFREIGVAVQLEGLPAATYANRSNAGDGQAFIGVSFPFVPDAAYHLSLFWQTGRSLNVVGYSNEAFDRVMDEMLVELNEEKRQTLAREAQRIWLEDMPWLLLGNPGFRVAHAPGVEGFVWYGDNQIRYRGLQGA